MFLFLQNRIKQVGIRVKKHFILNNKDDFRVRLNKLYIFLYFKTFIIFAFAHKLKNIVKPLRRVIRK